MAEDQGSTNGLDDGGLSSSEIVARLDQLWRPSSTSIPDPTVDNVGHFSLERPIGCGTFGVVYRAFDTRLNRTVALKLPRPEVLMHEDKWKRFVREVDVSANLHHPGIVATYEANLETETPYLVTEFCDGLDLAEYLEDGRRLSWSEAFRLMVDVTRAVQYAHSKGVLHRDLKPANLLLVPKDRTEENLKTRSLDQFTAKLTDFGLAGLTTSVLGDTRSSLMIGTPLYMAPEQLNPRDPRLTAAADIYSLGVILFELLTGEVPVTGTHYVEVIDNLRAGNIKNLKSLRDDLPNSVIHVIKKCLETDPSARYQSAAELVEDLERCLAGEAPQGKRIGVLSRCLHWCRKPERIKDAGRYTLISQILLIPWTTIGIYAVYLFDVIEIQKIQVLVAELLFLLCVLTTPVIAAGWFTLKERTWAVWVGFATALLTFPVALLGLTGQNLLFGSVYRERPFLSFVNHVMVALVYLAQLFFFSCALAALKNRAAK